MESTRLRAEIISLKRSLNETSQKYMHELDLRIKADERIRSLENDIELLKRHNANIIKRTPSISLSNIFSVPKKDDSLPVVFEQELQRLIAANEELYSQIDDKNTQISTLNHTVILERRNTRQLQAKCTDLATQLESQIKQNQELNHHIKLLNQSIEQTTLERANDLKTLVREHAYLNTRTAILAQLIKDTQKENPINIDGALKILTSHIKVLAEQYPLTNNQPSSLNGTQADLKTMTDALTNISFYFKQTNIENDYSLHVIYLAISNAIMNSSHSLLYYYLKRLKYEWSLREDRDSRILERLNEVDVESEFEVDDLDRVAEVLVETKVRNVKVGSVDDLPQMQNKVPVQTNDNANEPSQNASIYGYDIYETKIRHLQRLLTGFQKKVTS
jgi:hypothetical protein